MHVGVVLSDAHAQAVDPRVALARDREFLAAARSRVDALTFHHRWGATGLWNLQAISYASFLAGETGDLHVTVRGIPLGVLNPVEVAEQLATLDHAYAGRFAAGVVVAPDAALPVYGIDRAMGLARFEESLDLLRKMWAAQPFVGSGPHFRFAEVRPTLRPFRAGGPPVSLDAADAAIAELAGRHDLGLHIRGGTDADTRSALLASFRNAGGTASASVAIKFEQVSSEELARLNADGFEQVDVRIRRPGDADEAVLRRLDELAADARSAAVY